jgi:hypothetical protein
MVAAPAKATDPVTADRTDMRQQITAKLKAAGFTDVKVIPESFLVQAKDASGSPVSIFLENGAITVFATADAAGGNMQKPSASIFTEIPANEDLSSKLVGLDIYNAKNEKIGTIKDVAFGNHGVKAYIVGVGGFLGMGDHFVAIRPSAIKVGYTASDKKWHATMDTTAADLKAAPEYKYASN